MPVTNRPQSARTFSSKEYEEAKRRVRRLDATCNGSSFERPDSSAQLRADGEKLSGVVEADESLSLGAKNEHKTMQGSRAAARRNDSKHRDVDFVSNLQRSIAELHECIIGRLTPYPQLQVKYKNKLTKYRRSVEKAKLVHTLDPAPLICAMICYRASWTAI